MPNLTALVDELLAATPAPPASASGPTARRPVAAAAPTTAQSTRLRAARTVGREPVLASGRLSFDQARHLAITGEPGLGKSRLLQDLAAEAETAGLSVARGRGVPGGRGETYRPIAEIAAGLVRAHGVRLEGDLWPHRAALGLLVPGWSDEVNLGAPVSSFVVAEAVSALVEATSRTALLVVDDVQWVDVESLEIIDALVRRGGGTPYRLLLASRPGSASEDLFASLETDTALGQWRLRPLSDSHVAELAELVVEGRLPPALLQTLVQRSDGVPLVVEELVNSLVLSGAIVRSPRGGYELRDHRAVVEQLPESLAVSVRSRLHALDEDTRRLARGAALLGREFGSDEVAHVTGLTAADVRRGLALMVESQLLERLVGGTGADHRFGHALTREAVLTELTGPELADLAATVLDSGVVARSDHGPAGLERTAELALIAQRDDLAARLLAEAGAASAQQGALASAERLLRRSLAVAEHASVDAAVDLVEVLARAGRTAAAHEEGERALVSADRSQRARLHLALARVAETATELPSASSHLDAARSDGADAVDLALIESRLLLAERRLEEGQDAALRALRSHRDAAQACEALELLSRCARTRGEAEAEGLLERMAALAEQHSLPGWQLRALSELGTLDLFRLGGGERLRAARDLATASGDLVTATLVGYHESIRRFHAVEFDGWERWVDRVASDADTFGLGHLVHAEQVLTLCFLALSGRLEEARTGAAEVAHESLDPDREAALWGVVQTLIALADDDVSAATAAAGRGVDAVADREFGDPSPMWGTHALLATIAGAGPGAAADVRRRGATVNRVNAGLARWCDAIVAGRTAPDEAAAIAQEAVELLAPAPFYAAVAIRLARPLAVEQEWADGWEAPARQAAEFLREHGLERPAQALGRTLRRGSLAPAGDVASPTSTVDALTSRERDVLRELRQGLTNAEIADRLYISPRTVEKHVEHLLAKTGSANRTQLATRLL